MNVLTLLSSFKSNYNIINQNNVFNFLVTSMKMIQEDQRTEFVKQMRLNIGNTFTDAFHNYLFMKDKTSILLKHF